MWFSERGPRVLPFPAPLSIPVAPVVITLMVRRRGGGPARARVDPSSGIGFPQGPR